MAYPLVQIVDNLDEGRVLFDFNAVQAFQLGGFGRGPWTWVAPDMVAANLVSPWDSIRGQSTHALCPAAPAGYAGADGAVMPDGVVVPGTSPARTWSASSSSRGARSNARGPVEA